MKVIFISHLHPSVSKSSQNIGGTQTVSLQLLQGLKNYPNVTVCPLVLSDPKYGVVPSTARFLTYLYRQLPAVITAEKADLVFFISMVTASMACLRRQALSVPLVTLTHGHDVIWSFPPYQWFVPQVFQNLDGVVSVSTATQKACLSRGLSPEKSRVLPNGIPIDPMRAYSKEGARFALGKALNLNLEGFRLLISVGRQIPRKGHQWFIEQVFPLVQTKSVYVCIGTGPEAEAIAQARAQSPKSEQIVLPGRIDSNVLQLAYDAADLVLMPNIPIAGDMEGFGVVILEANEARTPVIATALEGMQDVIEPGVNGFLVPPLEPELFAAQIDQALVDRNLHLSQSCYQQVLSTYQWPQICDRYVEFFQTVLARCN